MVWLKFYGEQLVVVNFADIFVYNLARRNLQHLTNSRWILPKDELAKRNDSGSLKIQSANFSPSGKYFAYSDDHKQLVLYKTGEQWQHIGTTSVVKRAMSVIFTESEDKIVVADKSGDVYSFDVENFESGTFSSFESLDTEPAEVSSTTESQDDKNMPHPLMGHLSTILDMTFTKSSELLITCDRDEKIRISRYPNLYNIQAYCLGHLQYVVKLLCVKPRNVLLSTSGDGSVRCWNIENGEQLAYHQIQKVKNDKRDAEDVVLATLCHCQKNDIVAVSRRSLKELHFLKLVGDDSVRFESFQILQLDTFPLDTVFDSDGNLWVLRQDADKPVAVYQLDAEQSSFIENGTYDLSKEFEESVIQSMKDHPVDSAVFNPVRKFDCTIQEHLDRKTANKRKLQEDANGDDGKKAK